MNRAVDPVTTEILRNAFSACAEDMNAALIRSAYSALLYEIRDCSVALLDEQARILGVSSGLPIFLGNLEVCVLQTAELFGWDVFEPGDVWMMNDSYMTGTHLGDVTVFSPMFDDENVLVGFGATRAHWPDIGAKDTPGPTDSTEIYQEGMRWGPTKLFRKWQPRAEMIDLIRRNVRYPISVLGDLNAQVAACRVGEARLRQLVRTYGRDVMRSARDEIFRQSEQLEREAIGHIPPGVYKARGFVDSDGLGNGPIPVHVAVEVEGDQITIDLTGSALRTLGPLNCGFAQTISACRVAMKYLFVPERQVDGGCFKTLTVKAPEGSVFRAVEPAACQWYFTPLGLLIDLVVAALAPAIPDKVAAAHYGDSMVLIVNGFDPRKGNARFTALDANTGGWGGHEGEDGESALINTVNAGLTDTPIEVVENKCPIFVRGYGLRTDSGGAGRFRGGCGTYREIELLAPAGLSLWFDRSVTPAWGLLGGKDAVGPDVVINPGTADERHFLKVNALPVKEGDIIRASTGGGGGFGNPLERDPWRVRDDVIGGYVSADAARSQYGVVLRPDGTVDEAATAVCRASMVA